jgi:hypothetical protein
VGIFANLPWWVQFVAREKTASGEIDKIWGLGIYSYVPIHGVS